MKAEASGYVRAVAAARTRPGKNIDVDLPMVPRDRALPLQVEPPVLVFTSDVSRLYINLASEADAELTLAFELPPWLTLAAPPRPLAAGERRQVAVQIDPEGWREATAGLEAGASLRATAQIADQFDRLGLVQVVAVPAPPGLITLAATGPVRPTVRVGQRLVLEARAKFAEQPLVGAAVDARAENRRRKSRDG